MSTFYTKINLCEDNRGIRGADGVRFRPSLFHSSPKKMKMTKTIKPYMNRHRVKVSIAAC
jgi:hypothetical protein